MMDAEWWAERAMIVWDSDATCPCGADPKAVDGAAIDDERWQHGHVSAGGPHGAGRGPLPEVPVDGGCGADLP